ncbi:Nucleotide-diphospho-sugar transferase [Sesbania bispinosa]|nr:Nucleotide-diphospho-sugar transferase [Sesbania bispinosa]
MAPNITTATAKVTDAQAKVAGGRAFVTFLAGNGDYVKVLPDVPEEHRQILTSQGCIVREIEPVYPPENQTQFAMAYYVINYSKLRIWEFVEYSKMIYLDGHLGHTPQYQIGYCQQCPDKVQWPSNFGPKPPLYFNAGMFVFEPDLATYRDLLQILKVTKPTSFAEQDFLNMYFKDKYKPIPNVYNLVGHAVADLNLGGTLGRKRIWREKIKKLVKKWWDIYEDESLDCNYNPLNVDRFTAALLEAGGVTFVPAPSAA